ncbi:hypothetical protein ACFL01_02405 [Planctomycetota bacterium]
MFWMPCSPNASTAHDTPSPGGGQGQHRFRAGDAEYRIRVANDLKTRRAAFELVHSLYVEKGYTEPFRNGMWLSPFNLLPDTVTLVVKRGDAMVGTLTLVIDSELGLPCDGLYRNEVDALRRAGRIPSEIISLGVADEGKRASQKILVKLFNYVYMTAWYLRGATDFVITVNPGHAEYYRKTLLFDRIGGERNYTKVGGAPAVLMSLPLETPTLLDRPGKEEVKRRTHYKYFHTLDEEDEILPRLETQLEPMTEREFCYFAMQKTDVWEKASHEARRYLTRHYLIAMLAMEENGCVTRSAELQPEPATAPTTTESPTSRSKD